MARSRYFQTTTTIEKLSPKGYGATIVQKSQETPKGKAVIPFTVPGDTVSAEIGPKRKGTYVGTLLEVLTPSENRVDIRCKHARSCGGCSLQQMEYGAQIAHKQKVVEGLFGETLPIIPAKERWHYRNKMEYTFSQDREGTKFLGLIRAASKGRVEQIEECFLSPEWFVKVLTSTRQWWEGSSVEAFHSFKNIGSLRTLTLREGKNTGDKMVILTVSGVPEYALGKETLALFTKSVKEGIGSEENLSIFLRVQQTAPGRATQFYEMELFGPAHIQEKLTVSLQEYKQEYTFKISPTAFFQPNTSQAEIIYSKALELAGLKKRKRVLDLYAGTATLGMVFAPFSEKVIAVELNPYAVFDAEMNREINHVENLQIYKGDVAEVLSALYIADSSIKQPELVVIDPPRAGLMRQAKEILCKLMPEEILYISCNPATQAEDVKEFCEAGYQIKAVQPIDQFPHTAHLENIVLLSR